ncbi:MAG TPA: LytR C-terminal domain-containing protein [Microthrixaceae bacterium]|nr:LytR C-terminal domain-containing protein [Microthrixaceae bacterium]
MTDVQTERPGADDPRVDEDKPVSRDRARDRRRGGGDDDTEMIVVESRRRTGTWLYAAATLLFVVGVAGLAWQGWETAKEVKGGNELDQVSDPDAPGYQAEVDPTPTRLLGMLDGNGDLADLVVLAEGAGRKGGAAVFVPGVTVVPHEGSTINLATVYEQSGWAGVTDAVGRLLGAGLTQSTPLTVDQQTALYQPVGSLTIDNPDAVIVADENGDRRTEFEAGPITLDPAGLVRYMQVVGVGESEINRASRAQLVWEAWFEALRSGGANALPTMAPIGEGDEAVDLASVVRGLSEGEIGFQPLPLERVPVPGTGGFAVYRPDGAALAQLTPRIVPFPSSAYPGQRPRVRILNGTQDKDLLLRATGPVVGAGGQVMIIGNADGFGVPVTTVEYHDPAAAEAGAKVAEALGVTATPSDRPTDAYDVTVTLGADFVG